jgi:hypothetical protein
MSETAKVDATQDCYKRCLNLCAAVRAALSNHQERLKLYTCTDVRPSFGTALSQKLKFLTESMDHCCRLWQSDAARTKNPAMGGLNFMLQLPLAGCLVGAVSECCVLGRASLEGCIGQNVGSSHYHT